MKQLREYQQKIVNKVLASNKDTLISLPTGGGKTVIATAIMPARNTSLLLKIPCVVNPERNYFRNMSQ